MDWKVVTRPMLIDSQRPEYCPCVSEEPPTCPVCPATVKGDDIVGGVCQALRSGPPRRPLVELVVVPRDIDLEAMRTAPAATVAGSTWLLDAMKRNAE